MVSRKMALATFLLGTMVLFASMEIGESIRYRIEEPCFGDCMNKCMAVGATSSPSHCREQCEPLCSKIVCFFCWPFARVNKHGQSQ
ncbi:hypothetical protein L484_009603 [Morus notabilis]|uniref:Thionin-like protein n=1 Tax=Morus notabilis TaxID=981085 RepID=W9SHZ0_9ROSA|nr:hypothetical protein L484_009603 [Morus notabilis]